MNPVPNLIKDREGNRICVFTYFAFGDSSPAVYFYDFVAGKEIAKATGAQLFLTLKPLVDVNTITAIDHSVRSVDTMSNPFVHRHEQ